jgi:hypothetical protein
MITKKKRKNMPLKTKLDKWLSSIIIILITGGMLWLVSFTYKIYDGRRMFEQVQKNKVVYVYDTVFNALNCSKYITKEKYYNIFLTYNNELYKRNDAHIEFPIKTIAIGMPMYLLNDNDFESKSPLIKLVKIDTLKFEYPYEICTVYRKAVHLNLPNDTLMVKFLKFIDTLPNKPQWVY